MKPEYLSVSQVTTFLACPMRYRLRYVDQATAAAKTSALVLGSTVHSAVEWLQRAWSRGSHPAEAAVVSIFEADLQAAAGDEIRFREGEDLASLRKVGTSLISLYCKEVTPASPKGVELPFEVKLSDPRTGEVLDVPMRGWIDLVEADGTLVELKTASKRYDAETLALHLQLSTYSYAALRLYRQRPALRLDCLLKTREPKFEQLAVERSEVDDARLFRIVRDVLAAIEAGSFFPNPSWQCRDCEFRLVCPLWS